MKKEKIINQTKNTNGNAEDLLAEKTGEIKETATSALEEFDLGGNLEDMGGVDISEPIAGITDKISAFFSVFDIFKK